jgi:hypothetical protein
MALFYTENRASAGKRSDWVKNGYDWPILGVERDWKPDTKHACSHHKGVVNRNRLRSTSAGIPAIDRPTPNDLAASSRQ